MKSMPQPSIAGLLNDSWWNRTFWMYTERWPGFYIANQAPKTGQLLAFDDSTTYGIKCRAAGRESRRTVNHGHESQKGS